MSSKINHCTTCKEYYEYKENLCSNCYKFKTTGVATSKIKLNNI